MFARRFRRRLTAACCVIVIGWIACPAGGVARADEAAAPIAHERPASPFETDDPAQFVRVVGDRFMLGDKPFVMRGTNYFGSWREAFTFEGQPGVQFASIWMFYKDWDAKKVDLDFQFLRTQLNATVVRVPLPAESDFSALVKYHGFTPWFTADGTITENYARELVEIADAAARNGIRIEFCLLWNVGNEIDGDGEPFKLGAAKDRFYANQVRSVAQLLHRHPAVIAYSIGNEVLVHWQTNGTHRSAFEPHAAAFMLRRYRDLRVSAPHQMVTTDESAAPRSGQWYDPGPEFAAMPDIDGANGGKPFRLIDNIDYLGPHFYPETLNEEDLLKGFESKLSDAAKKLRAYLAVSGAEHKPAVLNEVGLQIEPETMPAVDYGPARDALFNRVLSVGQESGLQGLLAWSALPRIILRPGHFAIAPSELNKWSKLEVDITESNRVKLRILFYSPYFELFSWDPMGSLPAPLPAAVQIYHAWATTPFPVRINSELH